MRIHLMHIPKTGGITLHRALQQAGVDVTRSHDPAEADKLMGHTLVITLLRNPVERIWSVYRYQLRNGHVNCELREFLYMPSEPWWWGVHGVQARYMRPGVLYGTTDQLDALLRKVCTLAGVAYPQGYEWHGITHEEYTVEEYNLIASCVGDDAFVRQLAQGW